MNKKNGLIKILENISYFKDICNVYIIKNKEKKILIDFGSGTILEQVLDLDDIQWILHTHCHRDQCQGDSIVNNKIRIAVPRRELSYIKNSDIFWEKKQFFHYYGGSPPDSFFPIESVDIDTILEDDQKFEWSGYDFFIKYTPGHTPGSISLISEIEGKKVAFTGDLIFNTGKIINLYNLQWRYGGFDGAFALLESISKLKKENVDLILPSHGKPITDSLNALNLLESRIENLIDLSMERKKNFPPPMQSESRIISILPHLFYNPSTNSHFYAIIENGDALFLDYGCSGMSHIFADSFVEHSIQILRKFFGLKKIEIVVPSHYHDDHIAGILFLQKNYGTKLYAHKIFADILENPEGYNIPCLQPEKLYVDRILENDETFEWHDYNFTTIHLPGHTEYAQGLFFQLDGKKIIMTGDNLNGTELVGNLICRNWLKKESYLNCAKKMIELKPDLVLTGHNGPQEVTIEKLNNLLDWANKLKYLFEDLLPEPTNVGLDPNWLSIYPYYAKCFVGKNLRFSIRIRNYFDDDLEILCNLKTPVYWSVVPLSLKATIKPGETDVLNFTLKIPNNERPGRKIISVSTVLSKIELGKVGESIIDVNS